MRVALLVASLVVAIARQVQQNGHASGSHLLQFGMDDKGGRVSGALSLARLLSDCDSPVAGFSSLSARRFGNAYPQMRNRKQVRSRLDAARMSTSAPADQPEQTTEAAEADTASKGSDAREVLKDLVFGAVAASAGSTATAPLNRATAILQADPMSSATLGQVLMRDMFRPAWEAFQNRLGAMAVLSPLLSGNGARCAMFAPETAIAFALNDAFIGTLARQGGKRLSFIQRLLCGGLAGSCADVLMYPLKTVQTQLLVDAARYNGIVHCLTSIFKQDGLRGLYSGLAASQVGNIGNFAIMLGTQGWLVEKITRQLLAKRNLKQQQEQLVVEGDDSAGTLDKLSVKETGLVDLYCGFVSTTLSVFITYPVFLLRTLQQMTPGVGWKALWRIFCNEGFSGIFRGAGSCLLAEVPAQAIAFFVYSVLRRYFA